MMEKHFTVTTYVLEKSQVLLIFHPKLRKWLPPGGHLEVNESPPEGALREVLEETGLEVELIKQENIWINCKNAASFERPYLCLIENIPQHGAQPPHQHIDLIYLARPIGGELNASHGARWFTLDEVQSMTTDEEIFGDIKETVEHLFSSIDAAV